MFITPPGPAERQWSDDPAKRQTRSAVHWMPVADAIPAEIRVYDQLFTDAHPDTGDDLHSAVNKNSKTILRAYVEPSLDGCDRHAYCEGIREARHRSSRLIGGERLVFEPLARHRRSSQQGCRMAALSQPSRRRVLTS